MTRTATGNAILIRLAASTMLDGATNTHELEALYDAYDYEYPDISRKVYDFIRKCGISKVSKRTIKLAQLAVDYFENKERKFDMTNLKDLYIPCPGCDTMMVYEEGAKPKLVNGDGSEVDAEMSAVFNEYDTVTYVCEHCGCSITTLRDNIEQYATMIAEAHGIYNEEYSSAPTPEEEEEERNELGNDEPVN